MGTDLLIMLTDISYVILTLLLCSTLCIFLSLGFCVYAKHFLIGTAAVIMCALLFSLNLIIPRAYENISIKNAEICATVYEIKPATENSYVYVLKNISANGKEYKGYTCLYSSAYSPALPGDRIEFTASEFFSQEATGLFRYHSLSSKGYFSAFCREQPVITQTASDKDIISLIGRFRQRVCDKYFDNMDYASAAVTTALITGNKDYIPDEIALSFRLSGISHIFAVSGMHLTVWTSLFFIIFRQRAKSAVIPNIAAILFVIFFCIFTGFSPSVMRAGIMLITAFSAKLFIRQADGLNSLGIAASVLLIFNPFLAGNVSFLLSFAATFTVIWFSEFIIPQMLSSRGKRFSLKRLITRTAENIMTSATVILTTLPITSVFFGYVSLLSPVTGLIITPLAEGVMILSSLSLLAPTGSKAADFLFCLTQFFSSAITELTAFFAQADFMILGTQPSIVIPWFIISAAVMFTAYLKAKSKRTVLLLALTSTAVLLCLSLLYSAARQDETRIYIPEGNNATNVSVVVGSGAKSLVYGTGGDYESVTKTTAYLNSAGIIKADAVIIPRDTAAESENTDAYKAKLFPKNVLDLRGGTTDSGSSFSLSEGVSIYCKSTDEFCAAVITADDIKIIICSLPCSDFSQADPIFGNADILICRNALPESINPDSFREIIVMTDTPYSTAYATASTYGGDIEITLKGDTYAISR